MTIAYIADLHIANHKRFGGAVELSTNQRCRTTLNCLAAAAAITNEKKSDALVILGDTFDDTKPLPQIIAQVSKRLDAVHCPVFVLAGNHDIVSGDVGDHALEPLKRERRVEVIDRPMVALIPYLDSEEALLLVPFHHEPAKDWLEAQVTQLVKAAPKGAERQLCVHMGVSDETTPPYLKTAPDQIEATHLFEIMERNGIKSAFAGNWHFHRVWEQRGMRIVQVGALAPTGFDNPGPHYGNIVFSHMRGRRTLEVQRVPGVPIFLSFDFESGSLEDIAEYGADGRPVYVQMRVQPKYRAVALEALKAKKEAGLVTDGEVTPNREVTRVVARSAAAAARNASSIDEAVAEYIAHMTKPEGVDTDTILSRVNSYLAKNA